MVEIESFEEGLEQLRVAHQNVHHVSLCTQPFIRGDRFDGKPQLRTAGSGKDLIDHDIRFVFAFDVGGRRYWLSLALLHNRRIV